MRYQERIYIQNDNRAVRNRNILNVNMSSDICVFEPPTFDISGATKIQCGPIKFSLSGVSMPNILTGATYNCFGTGSTASYSSTTWYTTVYQDNNLEYSGTFYTTNILTGNTPTFNNLINSLESGFNSLGYDYIYNGDTSGFTIYKPYGVKELDIDICISFGRSTGSCSDTCVSISSDIFPYIDNTSQGVYLFNASATTLPLTFNFTGNTSVLSATNTSFKYEIYKYNPTIGVFTFPAVYKGGPIQYASFSGTNQLQQSIPLSTLTLDGEFVIKGFYQTNACTDFLNRLGKTIDTSIYKQYGEYQLYNSESDFYFVGITGAGIPSFVSTNPTIISYSNVIPLYQQVILVDDYLESLLAQDTPDDTSVESTGFTYYRTGSTFTLQSEFLGNIIVTLNGLSLSQNIDYTLSGTVLTFIGPISNEDIITIIYTKSGTQTIVADTILLDSTIISGTTNNQGNNRYYYNTTTGYYEVYTQNQPLSFTNIIVILNGITLASNIDFYQSVTNPNRIILTGSLMVGDIITIVYYPKASIINGISQNSNLISWNIPIAPTLIDGVFDLEYSTNSNFSTYNISNTIPYQINVSNYSSILSLSGSVGTNWYYRVKNVKTYPSICGDGISSTAYSETVNVVIQSNAINSY